MKIKRIFCALLSLFLLVGLVACSSKTPQTAVEVFKAYEEATQDKGFHMNGEIDALISMSYDQGGSNASVDVPMEMSFDADSYNDLSHGTMKVSIEAMGENVDAETEFYIDSSSDESLRYFSQEDGNWTVESEKGGFTFNVSDDILDKAKLELSDEAYVVVISFSDMMNDPSFNDLFEDSTDLFSGFGGTEFKDVFENCKVKYTFDSKTFYLESIEISDISAEDEDSGLKLSIECSVKLNFSDYGEITVDDVAIPDDIKENAIQTSESGSLETNINLFPEDDPDAGVTSNPSNTPNTSGNVSPVSNGQFNTVVYNGQTLNIPFDYNVLVQDGWHVVDDGKYSFVVLQNKKYDDEIYAYSDDYNGFESNLIENGVYGIDIDIMWSDNYPDFSIGGITWGSSVDDIKRIFGEPDYLYNSSSYSSYTYTVEDNYYTVYNLTFSLTDGGVTEIDIHYTPAK